MSIPTNIHEMLRARYKRLRDNTCKGCGASIAWFKTTAGSFIAFNLPIENNYSRVIPHKETCPKAEDFIGPAQRAADLKREREAAVDRLCEETGAAIVVALFADREAIMQWLDGLSPDQAQHDLVSAASKLRFQLAAGVRKEGH